MCFLWLHVVPERYPHAINQTLGTANGRTQPRIIARRRTLPFHVPYACVRDDDDDDVCNMCARQDLATTHTGKSVRTVRAR